MGSEWNFFPSHHSHPSLLLLHPSTDDGLILEKMDQVFLLLTIQLREILIFMSSDSDWKGLSDSERERETKMRMGIAPVPAWMQEITHFFLPAIYWWKNQYDTLHDTIFWKSILFIFSEENIENLFSVIENCFMQFYCCLKTIKSIIRSIAIFYTMQSFFYLFLSSSSSFFLHLLLLQQQLFSWWKVISNNLLPSDHQCLTLIPTNGTRFSPSEKVKKLRENFLGERTFVGNFFRLTSFTLIMLLSFSPGIREGRNYSKFLEPNIEF